MIKRYLKPDNPLELLAFAALFLFAGVFMLLQTEPMIAVPNVGRARSFIQVLSPKGAHIVGVFVIVIALLVSALYFYVRFSATRPATRDE